jgi:hypothetical protein
MTPKLLPQFESQREKKRKRLGSHSLLSGHAPNDLKFLPRSHILKDIPHPILDIQPLIHGPLESIPYPNCSIERWLFEPH